MNREPRNPAAENDDVLDDVRIPGGCILCGGDLSLRVRLGTARTFCEHCRWISRPQMHRHEHGIEVIHPAAGLA